MDRVGKLVTHINVSTKRETTSPFFIILAITQQVVEIGNIRGYHENQAIFP